MSLQRVTSVCLALAVLSTALMLSSRAEGQSSISGSAAALLEGAEGKIFGTTLPEYSDYLSENSNIEPATEKVVVADKLNVTGQRGKSFTYEVDIQTTSLYELTLTYRCIKPMDAIISLSIDGTVPFAESERLVFPAYWVNDGDVRTDTKGNEFAPEQKLYEGFISTAARDYSGMYENPYCFVLKPGRHTFDITVIQGELMLDSLVLTIPEQPPSYNEWISGRNVTPLQNELIVIEGESAVLKSNRALIPLSDSSTAEVSPSDPITSKINHIGGSNWKKPGDTLTWEFTVKKEGYYSIGAFYRQNTVIGGVSYRHLRIDDETPFDEARRLKFTYGTKWKYMNFGNDKSPYLVYLKAGKHTLSLSVTIGEFAELYAALKNVTSHLGELYVDITMVVGETVDVNRSYELFQQIPEFNERLDQAIANLRDLVGKMEDLQEKSSGTNVSIIQNAIQVLTQMRENPYSAHRYKNSYYSAYTNLSALLVKMTDMPLDIDRIFLIGHQSDTPKTKVSIFSSISFLFQRFVQTFYEDYNDITDSKTGTEPLTIWVNWGRDQAQVLNNMVQDGFVRDTGIGVNIKVVNATLIQAILSGNGPDCMLEMSRTEPVNLAMRGALLDLSQFDDFENVTRRFADGATKPYTYKNGVYALPDTQNFYMMFVRTDILSRLGLKIPETWDDFIYATTILQRNNLQAYLPYVQITSSTQVNVGVGGLSLYPTLLIQNGLSLYTEDLSASMLSQSRQVQIFSWWVNLYTQYKIPVTMDFYNRFRIGSAPIGISNYTLYSQLKAAAPEIDGRWTVAKIPGTVQEDGSINHSSSGSGTGCSITKLSKNHEKAWLFLKWWTSEKSQLKFSNNLESLIGPLGRVAVSNTEAFNAMDWDEDMLNSLTDQRNAIKELPEVPGGYYVSRGIDQSFWNVIEQNKNPTDMLLKWSLVVNAEIARKQAEYSKK